MLVRNASRRAHGELLQVGVVMLCGVANADAAEVTLLHADAAVVRVIDASDAAEPEGVHIELLANGKVHRLNLAPNRQLDGIAARSGGRARAYAGDVGLLGGSWAAVTRVDGRWQGMWYDGGEYYGVDSAGALAASSDVAARLPPAEPVVFRLRDLIVEGVALEGDSRTTTRSGEELAVVWNAAKPPQQSARRLNVAAATDAEFVRIFGAQAEANVLAQLNIIDSLFANQLGLRVAADTLSVFADNGPFSTTADSDALLDEVAAWRVRTVDQRDTGVTHLFTGRSLAGRIVGMAFVDSLCTRRFAASLSQSSQVLSVSALIAAHEIGHVLGAPHDGDTPRPLQARAK